MSMKRKRPEPKFNPVLERAYQHEDPRSCVQCGCTDNQACMTEAGPCHWVSWDLCSACVIAQPADEAARKGVAL